jgi:class 3 adenylate cyclase
VLFCDLVDSTRLAAGMDAEDWRALVSRYHAAAGEVVARFEGHMAQYLGDGLLAYFGWPRAHEDDAERAVRSRRPRSARRAKRRPRSSGGSARASLVYRSTPEPA